MADNRVLKLIVIENSRAIRFNKKKTGNFYLLVKEWFDARFPAWTPLEIFDIDARNCGCQMSRGRAFLVSMALEFRSTIQTFSPELLGHQRAVLDVGPDLEELGLHSFLGGGLHPRA